MAFCVWSIQSWLWKKQYGGVISCVYKDDMITNISHPRLVGKISFLFQLEKWYIIVYIYISLPWGYAWKTWKDAWNQKETSFKRPLYMSIKSTTGSNFTGESHLYSSHNKPKSKTHCLQGLKWTWIQHRWWFPAILHHLGGILKKKMQIMKEKLPTSTGFIAGFLNHQQ